MSLEIDMNLWCFSIAPTWQNFLKTARRGNITPVIYYADASQSRADLMWEIAVPVNSPPSNLIIRGAAAAAAAAISSLRGKRAELCVEWAGRTAELLNGKNEIVLETFAMIERHGVSFLRYSRLRFLANRASPSLVLLVGFLLNRKDWILTFAVWKMLETIRNIDISAINPVLDTMQFTWLK